VAEFEQKNCIEVASYVTKNDISCEFRPVSGFRTFWTKQLLSEAVSHVEKIKHLAPEIGKDVTIVLEKKGLQTAKVQEDCPGATITKGAASLWPYKYVAWILKKLINDKKLNLQTNTAVDSIEPTDSSSARYKVHTSRGTVLAKHVLLATNAYTSHLLPSFSDLIVPVRETMTALVPPPSMKTLLPNSYGFVGFGENPNPSSTEYLIQRPFSGVPNPKGHLMLGGGRITAATIPSVGESDDSIIDPAVVDFLKGALPGALDLGLDAPKSLTADMAWTGIWAASRDELPWVGQVPGQPGLWLCAAYTGHGMPNATLCAKSAVKMIIGDEKGESVSNVMETMVKDGEIPAAYLLTEQRMAKARSLATVAVQEEQLGWGYLPRET
jgi:glycine/D-amino acid oxidase-like deaminating enzyme